MIDRKTLSSQLKEASILLEVLGADAFRARAYAQAARSLEAFEGDLAELAPPGGAGWTSLRGVGKGLAAELDAALAAGELPALAELRAEVPPEVRELFAVSGLGAKKVRALWGAGVVGLEGLVAAVEDGRVQALKGFGAKSAAGFRDGALFALRARERMRIDQAEALSTALVALLRERLPGARVEAAGEARRALETVGAVEAVLCGAEPGAVRAALAGAADEGTLEPDPGAAPAPGGGERAWRLRIAGRRARVLLADADAFGAALLARTGPEAFLARAGTDAATLERGLPDAPAREEADALTALGLPPLPPELRDRPDAEPVAGLLEPADVRGLVHNHTRWSDALADIREMVAAARERGYAYLALADHSRTSSYAGGLSIERVRAQAEEVARVREELREEGSDFELIHGLEVDILPDGSLDYPDEVLALLDYTVVSVHQNFTLSRADQTARIVRAVRHPRASILGHATGRLLLRRPGYDVDVDAVIDACAETGTVIEINANPLRLDLDWRDVVRAKARGCRFAIDPDAHRPEGYDDVRFGVGVARKAGLTPADVVNCAPTGRAFLARLEPAPS